VLVRPLVRRWGQAARTASQAGEIGSPPLNLGGGGKKRKGLKVGERKSSKEGQSSFASEKEKTLYFGKGEDWSKKTWATKKLAETVSRGNCYRKARRMIKD